MASHVDRLKESVCFKTAEMTCISCHNPHKSVTTTSSAYFDNKCMQCHEVCKEEETQNCASCHMPKSSSTDIMHVAITDHKISIPNTDDKQSKDVFLGLIAINNDKPTNLSKAKAYLKHFESFEANPTYLDSAFYFLQKTDTYFTAYVQYFYLKKDDKGLINFVMNNEVDTAKYSSTDLAMAYSRMGEVFVSNNRSSAAEKFFEKATCLMPYVIDYKIKQGAFLLRQKQLSASKIIFYDALALNPTIKETHLNLGYISLLEHDFEKADLYLKQALALDPDYILAYENLVLAAQMQNKTEQAKVYLNKILEIAPAHKAKELLQKL